MSRLINADKINYREHTECLGHGDFETVRTVTDKEIAEISTVDVVEVVRCKDCKEWIRNRGIADSPNGYCFYHETNMNGYGFCSYGERNDGDGNG